MNKDVQKLKDIINERLEAFKIARSIIRYDSMERILVDVRIEDLMYLLNKINSMISEDDIKNFEDQMKGNK